MPIAQAEQPEAVSGMIRFSQVEKAFPGQGGEIIALRGLDFSVVPGEFVSLVGPSGCGKTTVLNLIAGLERPTGGNIELFRSATELSGGEIGYVFQEPTLLPWRTIHRNVLLPLEIADGRADHDRVAAALEAVGLQAFQNEYPHSLSVGMRQRAAIARALVHDPKVLLMDEPFCSLDSIAREQMNFQLLEMWQRWRRTIVFVTHSISEAILLSDRVCLMSERPGSIREEFKIELPRPRTRNTIRASPFAQLLARIHQAFGCIASE